MSRNSYIGITFLLGVMVAGTVIYLSIVLNQKAKDFADFNKYVKSITNNEGLIKNKFWVKDSIAVYDFVAKEIISTCPDSTTFKLLITKDRSKANNLIHVFKFFILAVNQLPSLITNFDANDNHIFITCSIPCSKPINIYVCLNKRGNEFKIINIRGLRDLILHLDLVLKQN